MKTNDLTRTIENWLNKLGPEPILNENEAVGAVERFQIHTVKRLMTAYGLYRHSAEYRCDFLIALRDYLLCFDIDIEIQTMNMDGAETFGIVKDPSNGRFFATFQFPEYVNSSLAKQAFLQNYEVERRSSSRYDLHTDPMIFKLTGFSEFKSMDQKLAVYGALNTPDGYTTLVSLPTGGGKSLITQTMSYQRVGLTIIIVPTVSLAIDQVRVAKKIIDPESPEEEILFYSSGVDAGPILAAIKNRIARMLFISPEALINNPAFADAVKQANATRYLKNIIIDEAHIVVDWGTSFRVDYQCLEAWRNQLLRTNPTLRTVLLSATYERHCIDILHKFFGEDEKWIEIRCDSLRHEPRYMLIHSRSYTEKHEKLMELVRKLPHPMIIYVARPAEAESLKNELQRNGIMNVRTFTGWTNATQRKALIDTWVDDQFEIMIATSAFGVGVDKSDVRTVIHLYVPQNPNAYYQELGRGGRDRLPCLSVMCLDPEDTNATFQRISKRVMTAEKIIGRWNSLYSNPRSLRMDNKIFIDTTIKPEYSTDDEFDDSPASDTDVNWNVYVLLFLRRYNMIRIREVIPQDMAYKFVIEIRDDRLRNNDDQLYELIERCREEEWDYYNESFQMMKSAIVRSRQNDGDCWSEMFFETYDKVSEYCGGCPGHTEVHDYDFTAFPLKAPVMRPCRIMADDQKKLFAGSKNVLIITKADQRKKVAETLFDQRVSALLNLPIKEIGVFQKSDKPFNTMILDFNLVRELIKKKSYYYLSGVIAVFYNGTAKEIYEQYTQVERYLSNAPDIYLIHVLGENTYFDSRGKSIADLLDGPVIAAELFCGNV